MNLQLTSLLTATTLAFANVVSAESITLNLFQPQETAKQKQDFIDKIVVFIIDSSSSIDVVQKQIMLDSILAGLASDEVKPFLDAGNLYQFAFVSFADSATLNHTITVNNYDDAVRLVSEFFMGKDGKTPVQFANGAGTQLAMGFSETNRYLNSINGFYNELDVVIFTDSQVYDTHNAQASLKQIDNNAQIHCALLTEDTARLNNFINWYVSADYRNQEGVCTNFLKTSEITNKSDYKRGQEFIAPISAALRYTMG